jgi:uncharacterized membrane protein YgcG
MKTVLPLLALITFFTSCSTAYKSGQTPDDVYYSPERPQVVRNEYTQVDKENDRQYRGSRRNEYQDDYYNDNYYNDRYLRMMVRNRRTWSDLDFYYSDPYAYRYNYPNYFSNYWSPYSAWNSNSYWNYYYNPYCSHFYNPYYYTNTYYGGSYGNVIIVNPKSPVYNRPRTANLQVYNSPQKSQGTRQQSYGNYKSGDAPVYSTPAPRRSSNTGNELRDIFGSSNSSSSGNNSSISPSRPSSSSSGNSGSSGSSSSSSGGASRAPSRSF